ncbi:MAG: Hsp20/alpha crystallin family protein [Phycisphaeraceae bacterium]|nr:Hsp20/alpha crystallin family protein [Phycisphaeraceae bacterium]
MSTLSRRIFGTFPGSAMNGAFNAFGDALSAPALLAGIRPESRRFPQINAWETGDEIVVEAELPGFTMNSIEVTVVGNELTLSGRVPDTHPENVIYHRQERAAQPGATFSRAIHLATDIDSEQVKARFENGVLTVTLPKAPSARPRKITVSSK